jgi:dethiobiotin synthetase
MEDRILVTGIGTDIGKTVVSLAICQEWGHHYWKPVQTGGIEFSDRKFIEKYSPQTPTYPERYHLAEPASPHYASALEGIPIVMDELLRLPSCNKLCVEGAGGLLVPFNDQHTYLDYLLATGLHPVVVVRHYLGSINHTLLTLSALQSHGVNHFTLVWNGQPHPPSEEAILMRYQPARIYRVSELNNQQFSKTSILYEQ